MDYRFGAARIEESVILRICPKCGILFVPFVTSEDSRQKDEKQSLTTSRVEIPAEKQILKWP
jgi:hypothetical protein